MPIDFPSYPKVYRMGHRDIDGILDGYITVQEKVDGSQINWTWDEMGELHVRSKGQWQLGGPEKRINPDKIFKPAIIHLLSQEPFPLAHFFRGETLAKNKHNTLEYSRVPEGHIVLFDVTDAGWHHVSWETLISWAARLGIDVVPQFYKGQGKDFTNPNVLLEVTSTLGGPVEGIVIKNYDKFTEDKKPMMGKVVREEFQELHQRAWKKANPTQRDITDHIIDSLNTEPRYEKAVQYLRDQGLLTNSEKDIGALMKRVKEDVAEEEIDWILSKLKAHFMPQIIRRIGGGLPQWYKDKLNAERAELFSKPTE